MRVFIKHFFLSHLFQRHLFPKNIFFLLHFFPKTPFPKTFFFLETFSRGKCVFGGGGKNVFGEKKRLYKQSVLLKIYIKSPRIHASAEIPSKTSWTAHVSEFQASSSTASVAAPSAPLWYTWRRVAHREAERPDRGAGQRAPVTPEPRPGFL